ncbi:MAG TPA: hypothetical protein VFB12_16320 [Ktedonobacteraceae bacterium]|nr:hypothetical protein [Ktedonobacteraceae bacterium]
MFNVYVEQQDRPETGALDALDNELTGSQSSPLYALVGLESERLL